MPTKLANYKHFPDRLLNKALEKHGVTIESLREEGKSADDYCFDSEQDWLEWKDWCTKKIQKVLRIDAREAGMEFDMFDLSMGLSHRFNGLRVSTKKRKGR